MELGTVDNIVNFPGPLHGHINSSQYEAILQRLRKADNETLLMTCGGEVLCCCLTGFFCIFCCHPVIHPYVRDKAYESACADVNRTYFNRKPVFHSGNGGVIFLNVDSLPRSEPYPVAQAQIATVVTQQPYSSETTQSPMYKPPEETAVAQGIPVTASPRYYESPPAQATSASKYGEEESPADTHIQPPPAPVVSTAQEQMGQFIVPEGAQPGQSIQVTTPSGSLVAFTIPAGACAGSVINYKY